MIAQPKKIVPSRHAAAGARKSPGPTDFQRQVEALSRRADSLGLLDPLDVEPSFVLALRAGHSKDKR